MPYESSKHPGPSPSQHQEYDDWRKVVAAMKEANAVTPEDCEARSTDDSTPGRRLFRAITAWGESLAILTP